MNLEEVEQVVDEAVGDLPSEFKTQLDNVGFVVEPWPNEFEMQSIKAHPGSLLFGLYHGIPKTKRPSNYSALPDKITIFAGPILMVSKDLDDAKKRIKSTVFHEIGHHFGMSEEAIRKAESSKFIMG
jgi:predicted Zn-dependent protease with MMP-like domain